MEGARGEPAEIALTRFGVLRRGRRSGRWLGERRTEVLPAACRAQRERIGEESQRTGQHEVPEERAESALMRFAQRVLGGELRDGVGIAGIDRDRLPLRKE